MQRDDARSKMISYAMPFSQVLKEEKLDLFRSSFSIFCFVTAKRALGTVPVLRELLEGGKDYRRRLAV
jgi:hypothetical protein